MKTKNFFNSAFRTMLGLSAAVMIFTSCQEDASETPALDEVSNDVLVELTDQEINTLGITRQEAADFTMTKTDFAELTGEDVSNGRFFSRLVIESSPVIELASSATGLGDTVGFAKLIRYPNGVVPIIVTSGLEPNTANTLWVVAWNNPENCGSTPCGDFDAINPATNADMVTGTGKVARNSRLTVFATNVKKDDADDSLGPFLLGIPAKGVTDPYNAEFRFVIKTHGQVIPELLNDQLTTFQGGCEFGFLPPLPVLGTPGPNTCAEIQVSFFTGQ